MCFLIRVAWDWILIPLIIFLLTSHAHLPPPYSPLALDDLEPVFVCLLYSNRIANPPRVLLPRCSYCSMAYIADHLFPPIKDNNEWSGYDEYSNFNFWRDPVPEIPLELELAAEREGSPNGKKSQQQQQLNDTTGGGGGGGGRSSLGNNNSNSNATLTTIPEK